MGAPTLALVFANILRAQADYTFESEAWTYPVSAGAVAYVVPFVLNLVYMITSEYGSERNFVTVFLVWSI